MKVFIISTFGQKCGISTYSGYLAEALQNEGHEVKILAERKDVLPQGVDPDFPYKHISSVECWSRNEDFQPLLKIVETEKPDVVHIQHQFGLFPEQNYMKNLYDGLRGKTKIITTLHDVLPYVANYEQYFQTIINGSDKIIVHNETCYQLMKVHWKTPESKLSMIYHGTKLIDVPTKEIAREKLKIPVDTKVILSWGFIWESKGLSELVEILAQLKVNNPKWKLLLIHAGGLHPVFARGDYLKGLLKSAYFKGIKPTELMITGFVKEDDIPIYFGACDVIILNYMRGSASASGAAHRALSSHRPIVGTDDPCIQEVPKMEVMRGDTKVLMQAIKAVLSSPGMKQLVEKEEKFAEETSWKNIAQQHINLYV
jgi:glycosyltransferase involved in cell wall biosynthesis